MTNHDAAITNLRNLLDDDARKFTVAEVQLTKVLPGWIYKASSEKLKDVLQSILILQKIMC
jgi:hypothetical protein